MKGEGDRQSQATWKRSRADSVRPAGLENPLWLEAPPCGPVAQTLGIGT